MFLYFMLVKIKYKKKNKTTDQIFRKFERFFKFLTSIKKDKIEYIKLQSGKAHVTVWSTGETSIFAFEHIDVKSTEFILETFFQEYFKNN